MDSGTPPSAGLYNFLGWFETNKKRVAIGAGVLVAVGAIAGFLAWRSSEREAESETALSSVKMPFSPGETPAPGTAESLAKVADDYPKTSAGSKARLRAGTVFFEQGNYVKAEEQFVRFLRDYGDNQWVPEAVFGIAACLDGENKVNEAIAKYNDFIRAYPSDPSVEEARLNLARLYEQTKQSALALELLKKMTEGQVAPTPGNQEAQERMREIYAKHPELMPPPPSAMPQNVFTNIIRPQTNTLNLTNLIRRTNSALPANTNALRILPAAGQTNAGK